MSNSIHLLALQATSVGQAVAGFAVSVLSFLTTWAALVPKPGEERGPGDVAATAFAYFGLSAAVVVASMAGYWLLQLIPFWLHYTSSHSGHGTFPDIRLRLSAEHQYATVRILRMPCPRVVVTISAHPRSCTVPMHAGYLKGTEVALCAGRGKEEEIVQEEGGVTSNGRSTDEVQGPSDEVCFTVASSQTQPLVPRPHKPSGRCCTVG